MGIFRHRPFAFALALFLLSFAVVYAVADSGILAFENSDTVYLLFGIAAATCVITVFILSVTAVKRPTVRRECITAAIAAVLLFLAFFRAGEYFFLKYARVQTLVGESVSVTLRISEREVSSAGYTRYGVTVESVCCKDEAFGLSDFGAALILESASEYTVGDRLLLDAEGVALSELYEYPSYALADGCMIGFAISEAETSEESTENAEIAENAEEEPPICVLSYGKDSEGSLLDTLYGQFRSLQTHLSFALSEGIGGDAGALASAVLLGDRSGLDESVTRDFGRSGISHLLALSGLHMGILIGGFALILRKMKLPRWAVSCGMLIAIFAFLMLTGFSMSACRAGLMLAFAAMLGFCSRKPDAVTALFLAVSVILLLMPSAVCSIGLWMSFASVLGLLVFASKWDAFCREKLPQREEKSCKIYVRNLLFRILFAFGGTLGLSLIASFSVLPLLWVSGGEFSVFGIFTNLLTVSLMPLFLVLALLFLLFRRVTLIGSTILFAIRVVGGWILAVARFISALPGAAVSLHFAFAGVCVLLFLIPMLFLLVISKDRLERIRCRILKKRTQKPKDVKIREIRARWFFLPPMLASILYILCFTVHSLYFAGTVSLPVTVTAVSGGEILTLKDGNGAVLIDFSDGYYSGYRTALSAQTANGTTEWSRIVLTHYETRHISSVSRFCRGTLVREVLLPPPATDTEEAVMQSLTDRLTEIGIPHRFYERETEIDLTQTVKMTLSRAVYLERSVQPVFMLHLSTGERSLTYFTQSVEESILRDSAEHLAKKSTYLLYGSDGPRRREIFRVPVESGIGKAVLTYGAYNKTYMSPISRRMLERTEGILWEQDAAICRLWEYF